MYEKISNRPKTAVILFAVLLFSIGLLTHHQPFIRDDWWLLSLPLSKPNLGWTDIYTFARMPVSTLATTATLKTQILEHFPRLFLLLLFSVHVTAFVLFFETLIQKSGRSLANQRRAFVPAALIFTLIPNNYEIHLWHLLSLHALGALSMALAFRVRSLAAAITLSVIGLLTYDTFVFLLIGFSALSLLVRKEPFRDEIQRLGLQVSASLLLCLILKFSLGKLTGFLQVIPPNTSFLAAISEIKTVLRTLWLIHFYKASWVPTLCAWLGLTSIGVAVYRGKLLARKKAILIAGLSTLVSLPLCFNLYPAPRAYYGPQILQGLCFAYLLFLALEKEKRFHFRSIAPLLLLGTAFLSQWGYIFHVKDNNYWVIRKNERSILDSMKSCSAPCHLVFPTPDQGTGKDNIFPEFSWIPYYERLHFLYFPQKEIYFRVETRSQ
jgi:hypothetical protein